MCALIAALLGCTPYMTVRRHVLRCVNTQLLLQRTTDVSWMSDGSKHRCCRLNNPPAVCLSPVVVAVSCYAMWARSAHTHSHTHTQPCFHHLRGYSISDLPPNSWLALKWRGISSWSLKSSHTLWFCKQMSSKREPQATLWSDVSARDLQCYITYFRD